MKKMLYKNLNPTSILLHIKESWLAEGMSFAEKRVYGSSSFYRKRGGGRSEKLKYDIQVGFLAEKSISTFLKDLGVACTNPDVKIHATKDKSYDPDLVADNKVKIHCKSQSIESYSRYGASCMFQKSDPVLKRPSANDFIAMCVVDVDARVCIVYGFFSAKKIVLTKSVGEPQVPHLRGNKRALYLTQLLKNLNKDDRWGLFRKQLNNVKLPIRKINTYEVTPTKTYLQVSGSKVKVDREDVRKIIDYGVWHLTEKGYVKNVRNCKYLHQIIMGENSSAILDHINNNPLDNRKVNLRFCPPAENVRNSQASNYKNTQYSSKYKGVSRRRSGSFKWVAHIRKNNRQTYLGDFRTEKEAAMAYNKAAVESYGEFAYLNKIEED